MLRIYQDYRFVLEIKHKLAICFSWHDGRKCEFGSLTDLCESIAHFFDAYLILFYLLDIGVDTLDVFFSLVVLSEPNGQNSHVYL